MGTLAAVWLSIVSGLVVILLIAVIVLIVLVVKVVGSVKRIAEKAEATTESLSDVAVMVGKRVAPVAISTAIAAALRRLRKK